MGYEARQRSTRDLLVRQGCGPGIVSSWRPRARSELVAAPHPGPLPAVRGEGIARVPRRQHPAPCATRPIAVRERRVCVTCARLRRSGRVFVARVIPRLPRRHRFEANSRGTGRQGLRSEGRLGLRRQHLTAPCSCCLSPPTFVVGWRRIRSETVVCALVAGRGTHGSPETLSPETAPAPLVRNVSRRAPSVMRVATRYCAHGERG